MDISYPIAIDNDYAIWRAFNNQYWPAHYFIDAKGQVRHHHFGEGDYLKSEKVVQDLLAEAGRDVTSARAGLDAERTKVEADVTGMSRIAGKLSPVWTLVHGSCGNGPFSDRPL